MTVSDPLGIRLDKIVQESNEIMGQLEKLVSEAREAYWQKPDAVGLMRVFGSAAMDLQNIRYEIQGYVSRVTNVRD